MTLNAGGRRTTLLSVGVGASATTTASTSKTLESCANVREGREGREGEYVRDENVRERGGGEEGGRDRGRGGRRSTRSIPDVSMLKGKPSVVMCVYVVHRCLSDRSSSHQQHDVF